MFYTGCEYRGERTADGKRFHEQGVFTYANGDTYVGAFSDGRMHGAGTLFFAAERGGGQYRGVWENGRSVSGAFVFADGLVYGAHASANPTPSDTALLDVPRSRSQSRNQSQRPSADSPGQSQRASPVSPGQSQRASAVSPGQSQSQRASAAFQSQSQILSAASGSPRPSDASPIASPASASTLFPVAARVSSGMLMRGWLYCREGDRRLWAEHLREVMPVLPSQTVLGGTRVAHAAQWAAVPVVAPSVAVAAKIPAAFAQGQPRTLGDIPQEFWHDTEVRDNVVRTTELPTPRFRGAQRDGGEETFGDGRPEMNLTQRNIKPVEPRVARAVTSSSALLSPLEGASRIPQRPSNPSKGFVRHTSCGDANRLSSSEESPVVPLSTSGAVPSMGEGGETVSIPTEGQDGTSPAIATCPSTDVVTEENTNENPLETGEEREVDVTKQEQTNEEASEQLFCVPNAEQVECPVVDAYENPNGSVETSLKVVPDVNEKSDCASPLSVEQLTQTDNLPPQDTMNLTAEEVENCVEEVNSPEICSSSIEEQEALINELASHILEGGPVQSPEPKEGDVNENPSSP